ncbi:hypothetical protein [Scytonema sp. PCC 10023]
MHTATVMRWCGGITKGRLQGKALPLGRSPGDKFSRIVSRFQAMAVSI